MHFFGQSNSCCLPFSGSQNYSGVLPESPCLDRAFSFISVCRHSPFTMCVCGCLPVCFSCSHAHAWARMSRGLPVRICYVLNESFDSEIKTDAWWFLLSGSKWIGTYHQAKKKKKNPKRFQHRSRNVKWKLSGSAEVHGSIFHVGKMFSCCCALDLFKLTDLHATFLFWKKKLLCPAVSSGVSTSVKQSLFHVFTLSPIILINPYLYEKS